MKHRYNNQYYKHKPIPTAPTPTPTATTTESINNITRQLESKIDQRARYYVDSRIGILVNGNELLTRGNNAFNINTATNVFEFKNNGNVVASVDSLGVLRCKNLWLSGVDVGVFMQKILQTFADDASIYVKHIDLKNGTYELNVKDTITEHLLVKYDDNNTLDFLYDNYTAMSMTTDRTLGYAMFNPNMTNGSTIYGLRFGKDNSSGAQLRYTYSTTAANSYIALGPIGRADTLNVYYDRRVIINTANNLSQCLVCKYNGNLSNGYYLRIGCGDNRDTGIFAYGRNNNANYLYLKLQGRSASVAVYSNYTSFDANDYILCNVTKKNSNVLQLLTSQTLSNNDYIRFLISDNANGKANIDLMHDSQYYGLRLKIDTADNTNDNKLCIWPTGVTIDGQVDSHNDLVCWQKLLASDIYKGSSSYINLWDSVVCKSNLQVSGMTQLKDTYIIVTGNSSYNDALTITDSNLTSGNAVDVVIGQDENSTGNSAVIAYHYTGDNDSANYLSIGSLGYSEAVKIYRTDMSVTGGITSDNIYTISGPGAWDSTKTIRDNLSIHIDHTPTVCAIAGFPGGTDCGLLVGVNDARSFMLTCNKDYGDGDNLRLYHCANGGGATQGYRYIDTTSYSRILTNRNYNANITSLTNLTNIETTSTNTNQIGPNLQAAIKEVATDPNIGHLYNHTYSVETGTALQIDAGPTVGQYDNMASCYNPSNGLFCFIGENRSQIQISYDGFTWGTTDSGLSGYDWKQMIWTGSMLVMVAANDDQLAYSYTGEGSSWHTGGTVLNSNSGWTGIQYSKSLNRYVCCNNTGDFVVYGSDIMSNTQWTVAHTGINGNCRAIAYGEGVGFVVVGGSDYGFSADGITWTHGTIYNSYTFYNVGWGSLGFIATDINGHIFKSANGTSWSLAYSLGAGVSCYNISYGGGWYCTTWQFNHTRVSKNLSIWETYDIGYDEPAGLAYGAGIFVIGQSSWSDYRGAVIPVSGCYMSYRLMMERVYPPGAIYTSMVNTDPARLFGFGTWTQIVDKFLYCRNTSQTTGGSATHTHDLNRSHAWAKLSLHGNGSIKYDDLTVPSGSGWTSNYRINTGGSGAYETYDDPYGCGLGGRTESGSTLPPYMTCYAWYRSA